MRGPQPSEGEGRARRRKKRVLSVGLREGVTQEVALELSSGFLRLHTQQGTQRAQKQGSLNEARGLGIRSGPAWLSHRLSRRSRGRRRAEPAGAGGRRRERPSSCGDCQPERSPSCSPANPGGYLSGSPSKHLAQNTTRA